MPRPAPANTPADSDGADVGVPTYAAFFASAILAGGNAVAVRFSNIELAPFWGASIRFLAAGALLFALGALMRLSLPRGRALIGVMLYGFFSFGTAYMFLYVALTEVTGGTVMMVVAVSPLLTLLIAAAIGLEELTVRAVAGGVTAAVGIAVVFGESVGMVSPLALAAALGGAASIAIAPIVVKLFPRVHAVTENALGMAVGGAFLLMLSFVAAEAKALPVEPPTQMAVLYLILLGSIGLFLLYMFVLRRMAASAATYILLLAPLSAAGIEAVLLGETVGLYFVGGGVLVIAGVYQGVIRRPASA